MTVSAQINKTFSHTLIYSGAMLLQKAIGFLLLPLYANYLGSEGYGIVGMIEVVCSVLTVSIGFGVTGGMQRFYYARSTEDERRVLISTSILLMFALVTLVSILALLLSGPISSLVFGGVHRGHVYVNLAVLTFYAEMTSSSAGAYILIKQRSGLYSAFSFARFIVGLTLNILLIVVFEKGVEGLLLSNLITTVLFSVAVHIYSLGQVGIQINRADAKDVLSFSLPLIPGSIAMLIRNDTDKVVLRMYMGLSSLGAYSMLANFTSLITLLIISPFMNIWSVKRYEVCETKDGPEIMSRVFNLHLSIMLFIGLLLAVEIPVILKVVTPREFWVPGIYAFIAVVGRILFGCYYHFQFGLSYAKLTKKISYIQIVASVVSIVSNLILVRVFGLPGALVASCLVFFTLTVMSYRASDSLYHIPFEWAKVAWISLTTVVLFAIIEKVNPSVYGAGQYLQYSMDRFHYFLQSHIVVNLRFTKFLVGLAGNFPLILDGVAKFVLSALFLPAMVFIKIMSWEQLLHPIKRMFKKYLLPNQTIEPDASL